MWNRLFICISLLTVSCSLAQTTDSSFVAIDSVSIDSVAIPTPDNVIANPSAIVSFYQKLADLEQNANRKINIVHIGDSHIQADLMTAQIRNMLQQRFGNAGRGFVFPHSVARTNGASDIQFSSTGSWESYRNIYEPNGKAVGLSGIALSTNSAEAAIEIGVKDTADYFNTIKIITPENSPLFDLAVERKRIVVEKQVPKQVTHKIKSGEALSIIADKYNVSLSALKKANNLKSINIRAGGMLKIPGVQTQSMQLERFEYLPLQTLDDINSRNYTTDEKLNKIYIVPVPASKADLNGIILENNAPGILYHNIGVNGAKLSDYNKYPLFFDQLKTLNADLIVVSLGTNESFDKSTTAQYLEQLRQFLSNVRGQNPGASVLILTPPPSLFQRKYPNTFAASYAKAISDRAIEQNVAVWDLYSQLGGLFGVSRNAKNGIIGSDRVHYTKAGYEMQGKLFVDALLTGYSEFKSVRK